MNLLKSISFCFLLVISTCSTAQTSNLAFYSSNTAGLLMRDKPTLSFQSINGISINGRIQFGIGIGFEQLDKATYLPLFFETKYNFRSQEKSTIPFISGMIGNEFSIFPHTAYGGVTGGGDLGINHFFSPHFGITVKIGYRYVYLNHSFGLGEIILPMVYDKHLLEIGIGITFR